MGGAGGMASDLALGAIRPRLTGAS
jgi:hypothetical protein